MTDFRPPANNSIMTEAAKVLLPGVLKQLGLEIHVTDNCLNQFANLVNQPTVLMVNHSDRFDPVVAFALSNAVNEDFYYLAALELFEPHFGVPGWFMQQCGAYSVVRGDPIDNVSRNKTISIIASARRKLLMFPEGDISGRDDYIMPLKKDGLANIFSAQGRIVGTGKGVHLLPIGMFYEVPSSTVPDLISSVSRLEKILHLEHSSQASLQTRIDIVIRSFINHLEVKYGVIQHPDFSPVNRLLSICRREIIGIGETIGYSQPSGENEADMLYSVRAKLRRLHTFCNCHYCSQLKNEGKRRSAHLLPELDRIQQLLILASTLQQPMNLQVAWRVLDRLELELLKHSSWKGKRIVRIEAARPIDIRKFWTEYLAKPKRAIEEVETQLSTALLNCLQVSKPATSHIA